MRRVGDKCRQVGDTMQRVGDIMQQVGDKSPQVGDNTSLVDDFPGNWPNFIYESDEFHKNTTSQSKLAPVYPYNASKKGSVSDGYDDFYRGG